MPQTALQICNSALIKLGGRVIPSYGYTATKEGELVTEQFPKVLNTISRGHVWSFLKTVATLSSGTVTTLDSWGYTHTLPSDLGRILDVSINAQNIEYERMGTVIYTIYDDVVLRYVRLVPAANYVDIAPVVGPPAVAAQSAFAFPDDFSECVACALAGDIAVSLTQNKDLHDVALMTYQRALADARFNGSVENSDIVIDATGWLHAHDTFQSSPYPDKLA